MAFSCPRNETENFNCVKVASVDLIKRILVDILSAKIKPADLFREIDKCSTLFSGKYKLRKDQLNICYVHPPTVPDYGRFDVTLLYTLIRNLCSSLKPPTQGWGNNPKSADILISDDVERLRLFRNNYFAHANSSKISDTEFGGIWRNLKSVINRIQSSIACRDYEQQLNLIEQTKYTREHLEECKLILEAQVNSNADEQDIVIKGDDEVICGETACFEADIENVDSSQSIRWRKRNGRLIEWIDKSTRKYSGSNNRKLVIQDVCKEDEGEYCAIISGDINGNEYENIRRNTICLHIVGEKPQIKDLKVTTENGHITIYCIFEVLIKSPKAHYIAWSKNDQTQNTKDKHCIGGSIHESCFPITSPSERDIGKYTCTVTNAIGSVSRDVKLDVPNVKISFDPIFKFGSKATITTEVSSNPSPEKLEWQKSKNGIEFHCIDIKTPKYYGSSEEAECPMLVILEIDFADKLHYRLVVWNIFGESISNTVFLDVKGSPPNITTSQETDIQNKYVKLIGNVFLYEGSPDILEVFWTKDSKRIETQRSGGKFLKVTIENPSLTIRNVNNYDAGHYQLTATNAVGSTSSNVIVLGIPNVTVKKRETQEVGSTSFVVTIESFPAPFAVQWMFKDKYANTFSLIDVSDENYMGTINSLPNPVLVVKNHTELRNNIYQIEITNYVGSTVKQVSYNVIGDQNIPGNGLRGDHSLPEYGLGGDQILPGIGLGGDQSLPGNGLGGDQSLPGNGFGGDQSLPGNGLGDNRTRKQRNSQFLKLCVNLMEHFPQEKLDILKMMLIADGRLENNITSLNRANSTKDVIRLIVEYKLLNENDVHFMQLICKEADCKELYEKCADYASTQETPCFFESATENGLKDIRFHIKKDLLDYTRQKIKEFVEFVAKLLGCSEEEILVNGLIPSASFLLVLSVKKVKIWKLHNLNGQERLILTKFDIDYFIVDENTITLNSQEDFDPQKQRDKTATDLVEEGAKYVARESLPDSEMDKCSSNDDSPPDNSTYLLKKKRVFLGAVSLEKSKADPEMSSDIQTIIQKVIKSSEDLVSLLLSRADPDMSRDNSTFLQEAIKSSENLKSLPLSRAKRYMSRGRQKLREMSLAAESSEKSTADCDMSSDERKLTEMLLAAESLEKSTADCDMSSDERKLKEMSLAAVSLEKSTTDYDMSSVYLKKDQQNQTLEAMNAAITQIANFYVDQHYQYFKAMRAASTRKKKKNEHGQHKYEKEINEMLIADRHSFGRIENHQEEMPEFFEIHGENILFEHNAAGNLAVAKWKLSYSFGLAFSGFDMFDNNPYEVIFCGSGHARVGFTQTNPNSITDIQLAVTNNQIVFVSDVSYNNQHCVTEIVKSVGKNGPSFETKSENSEFPISERIGSGNVWVVVYLIFGKSTVQIKDKVSGAALKFHKCENNIKLTDCNISLKSPVPFAYACTENSIDKGQCIFIRVEHIDEVEENNMPFHLGIGISHKRPTSSTFLEFAPSVYTIIENGECLGELSVCLSKLGQFHVWKGNSCICSQFLSSDLDFRLPMYVCFEIFHVRIELINTSSCAHVNAFDKFQKIDAAMLKTSPTNEQIIYSRESKLDKCLSLENRMQPNDKSFKDELAYDISNPSVGMLNSNDIHRPLNMNKDERGVEKHFNDGMDCEKHSKLETETRFSKTSEQELLSSEIFTYHLISNHEYFVANVEAFPLCNHLLQENLIHEIQYEKVLNEHRQNRRQEANRILITVLIENEYTQNQLQHIWTAFRNTKQDDLLPNLVHRRQLL